MRREEVNFDRSRREFLKKLTGSMVWVPYLGVASPLASQVLRPRGRSATSPSARTPLSDGDDAFLEGIERATFRFFWEQSNPDTGLVRDRCNVRKPGTSDLASIASTGFGLTAFCIGEKRGYISPAEARRRVVNGLRFLWDTLPNHRGFFYHWANMNRGTIMGFGNLLGGYCHPALRDSHLPSAFCQC